MTCAAAGTRAPNRACGILALLSRCVMSFTSEVTIVAGRSAIAMATTFPSTIAAVLESASNAPTSRALGSFNSGNSSTEPNICAVRACVLGRAQVSATTVAGTRIGVRFLRAALSIAANVGSLRSEAMIAPESRMILTEQTEPRDEPSVANRPDHDPFHRTQRRQRGSRLRVPVPERVPRSARILFCRPLLVLRRLAHEARSLQWFARVQKSERGDRRF